MPEASVSRSAVYSARPTIRIDEQAFDKASDLLIGMDMREQEGGLSALELRLSNVASDPEGGSDYAFENEDEIRLGSKISLYAGDEEDPLEIFRGLITGLEVEFPEKNPPEILLLAEDALQSARMTRRTLIHEEMSLADLTQALASRLNLRPVITGFTETMDVWVQLNESDLAFLRRLLRRYDGDVQVLGNELHVFPREEVQRGDLELALFSQLRRVKFIADLSDQVNEITVSGWDALLGQVVNAASTGQNLGPGRGRRGSQILAENMLERTEHVGRIAVNNNEEAQALAHSLYDQRARRFVSAHGTAEGNPALRVGTHVRLSGVSQRFQNTYYVIAVHHRFDVEQGYETDFIAESYTLGEVA